MVKRAAIFIAAPLLILQSNAFASGFSGVPTYDISDKDIDAVCGRISDNIKTHSFILG